MAETSWSGRIGSAEAVSPSTEESKPWTDRPQPLAMFYVQFADGTARGYQYFDMIGPEFLGDRVKVYFHYATLTIEGRHLRELFLKLLEHKVYAIRVQHEHEGLVSILSPYITDISLDDPDPKALTALPG
jgi:hypothetical protein